MQIRMTIWLQIVINYALSLLKTMNLLVGLIRYHFVLPDFFLFFQPILIQIHNKSIQIPTYYNLQNNLTINSQMSITLSYNVEQ